MTGILGAGAREASLRGAEMNGFGRIALQGYTTFIDYRMTVSVYVDPAKVDRANIGGANLDLLVAEAVLAKLGEKDDDQGETSGKIMELVSNDLGFQLLKQLRADPSLIGKTVTLKGPVRADAGLYYKGEMKRSTIQEDRKLDDRQLAWLDRLRKLGMVSSGFNIGFLTHSDSTEPEQAGVLGAVVGSALMLLVTAGLAVPIGVLAACYLEEFAPKNRWTDVIEVNINNLAAVPSIVYGLLGLAVFIPDCLPPRPAAGHARRDDRRDPQPGPRARRDRAVADDRHDFVCSGGADGLHLGGHRPAGAGVHLGERLGAGLP